MDFKKGCEKMFHSIEEAVADLKIGKPIIVVDDENRENEGDLVAISELATPEVINFMITYGKGLVCTSIQADHAEKLKLSMMTNEGTDPLGTAFTISVDHIDTTTGISAAERAKTIQALSDSAAKDEDFKRPGHTEASVDLANLSGAFPSGVICEIIKEDGTMARVPDLQKMAKEFDLKLISIDALIAYRKTENHIHN